MILHYLRSAMVAFAGVAVVALPMSVAAAPISIVAAESFYGDLAQQIGGAHVAVTSVLSNPDEDPHLFETSPSTARTLAAAAIVIANGADYDPWMTQLLSAATNPARTVIIAADLVGRGSGDNPHLWYDPRTFPAVATALAAELEQRDPSNAADYAQNLAAFTAAFNTALADVATIRAQYPGIAVTATEPVFADMAEAMGFRMLNTEFQLATMNETEPSPSQVAAFETSLRDGSAKILFYNSQVTNETTARLLALAQASGVPVVGVTETRPADQSIEAWFATEIAAVRSALDGHR